MNSQFPTRLALAAEALLWLGLAALALRLLPFRRIERLLTPKLRRAPPADGEGAARQIAWAIAASSRRAPWSSVCFHQAIAAQQMLARRGIAAIAHYGIGREGDSGRPAHLWVTVGGYAVVGGAVSADFHVLAQFSSKPGAW